MQVIEIAFEPDWIKGPSNDDPLTATRSAGLHLSTIYRDIESCFVIRDEMSPRQLATYGAGGFVWERMFEQAIKLSIATGDIVRPGEFFVDGIIGSPDYIDLPRWRVIETKCTWRSSRKLDALEKNFWVWLVQIKGYCRMVGSQEAVLNVLFINGDYAGSGPVIRSLELKWTRKEIEENWGMIKGHARKKGWIK